MPNGPQELERVAREFSKLKHAEIELWRNADALFVVHTIKGDILVANAAWTKYLGWSADEILSKPWFDLFDPEDIPEVAYNYLKMDWQDVGRIKRRLLHKAGHYENFILFASSWVEEAGMRVTYVTGIHVSE